MNYELTIYGPLVDNNGAKADVSRVVSHVLMATEAQCETVWQTLRDYPDFNSVSIHKMRSGDLGMHVYDEPIDVPEDVCCPFHAKISPSGTYA